MKKSVILRAVVIIMALCSIILALIIAYFFTTDIETREPEQIIEECEIDIYTYHTIS